MPSANSAPGLLWRNSKTLLPVLMRLCVCLKYSKVIACRLRWYLQVSGNSRYGNTLAGLKHHAAKAPLKT